MIRAVMMLTAFAILLPMHGEAQKKRGPRVAKPLPIIDMHIHADKLEDFGGGNLSICVGDGRLKLPAIDPKLPFNIQDMSNVKIR